MLKKKKKKRYKHFKLLPVPEQIQTFWENREINALLCTTPRSGGDCCAETTSINYVKKRYIVRSGNTAALKHARTHARAHAHTQRGSEERRAGMLISPKHTCMREHSAASETHTRCQCFLYLSSLAVSSGLSSCPSP